MHGRSEAERIWAFIRTGGGGVFAAKCWRNDMELSRSVFEMTGMLWRKPTWNFFLVFLLFGTEPRQMP